jgi:hypothetical protein
MCRLLTLCRAEERVLLTRNNELAEKARGLAPALGAGNDVFTS